MLDIPFGRCRQSYQNVRIGFKGSICADYYLRPGMSLVKNESGSEKQNNAGN